MSEKINFHDFDNKNVVSRLVRTLYLDKSQFDDLPSGDAVELKTCRVKVMDPNSKSNNIENVKYYEFDAVDKAQLDTLLAGLKNITGQVKLKMKTAFEEATKLTFKVNIQGGQAENAKELFDFVTAHSLDTNPNGRVLSGIDWKVTWSYLDQYHDVLALTVDSLADVKVK